MTTIPTWVEVLGNTAGAVVAIEAFIRALAKRRLVAILLAGTSILIFLIIYVLFPLIFPPTVRITEIKRGTTPGEVYATGVAQHVGQEQELWIVVIPEGTPKYYPQPGPVAVQADGEWGSLPFFLGVEHDVGKKFAIVPVLATAEAGSEFARHLTQGCRDGNFPGLNQLPRGATPFDAVTETRAAPIPEGQNPTPTPPRPSALPQTAPAVGVPKGHISSPNPGSAVSPIIVATGTVSNIPPGHEVWTAVEVVGRFYPQEGPVSVSPEGAWSDEINVGGPEDSGRSFVLHLVELGPGGSSQFHTYLRQGQATGSFPGIPIAQVAGDVNRLASVTVIRT